MVWLKEILLSFFISWGLTAIVIPRILLVSFKKKLFDIPDFRKAHKGLVPRLGGVSFFPNIFFSLSFVCALHYLFLHGGDSDSVILPPEILLILCALVLLYLVGIMDDLVGVRYRQKFIVQICCGVLLVLSGTWINNLYGLFGIHEISPYIGIPFTIFVVVFIINAINLIDGIDGLASGLSGLALLIFGILFFVQDQWVYSALAFTSLGVLIPFFYYNVFGNINRGRKIFMGDTGSLTIGMILASLAIRFSMYDESFGGSRDGAVVIAFSLLITPMFDVVRVVIHRLRNGAHPFKPDRNHIHHKFLALGLSPRKAMILILTISGIFSVSNILLLPYMNITLLLLSDIAVWTGMHIWITWRITVRNTISNKVLKKGLIIK